MTQVRALRCGTGTCVLVVTVIDAGIPCGKIIGTTVIENEEFLKELLDISPTVCFHFFIFHMFIV